MDGRGDSLVASGRAAMGRGDWHAARADFEAALAAGESAEALEGLGMAAMWLDDGRAVFNALERAYHLYRVGGERASAARVALNLANNSVEFRGQPAVANGWLQRARRLLDGLPPVAEQGLLLSWEGHAALMLHNDTALARRLGAEAAAFGRDHSLADVEILGLSVEGLALVSEGEVAEGMARLDEAIAAALGGETDDLNTVATACCYLIDACSRARDYDRAAQWFERFAEICRQWRVDNLVSICRPYHALVLMWRGAFSEAEAELMRATREVATIRPPMVVESIVRLADLRIRQGRWDEAAALLAQVDSDPIAWVGQATIAFLHGDYQSAAEIADRFLRHLPAEDRMERVPALEVAIRVALGTGDMDLARARLEELKATAGLVGTAPLLATARLAGAAMALAAGDLEAARRSYEDAVGLFDRTGARFEAARARIELAGCFRALGRIDAAGREETTAGEALRAMGASLAPLPAGSRRPWSDGTLDQLTPRETEILAEIARGRSNQEIAGLLVLSVRTVERHVSSIYEKIGASGAVARAVATAYALQHGLASS